MVYFTADLHLGHNKVIDFCKRPFTSVQAMDDLLIRRYNFLVKHTDTCYFLGDICFHVPAVGVPLLRRLNGKKVLVQGNHDKYSKTQYEAAGFTVLQEAVINVKGQRCRLSHYPPGPSDNGDPEAPAYLKRNLHLRPVVKEGEWILCGHVHEMWKVRDRIINVGVDVNGFMPVSENVLECLLNTPG